MRTRSRWLIFLFSVGLLLLAGTAVAQLSANYDLRWWEIAPGGVRQSANYRIQDTLGNFAGVSSSTSVQIQSGFVAGHDISASIPTPTSTPTATSTRLSTATATVTPSATTVSGGADGYENDDTCANAKAIATNGSAQNRSFHKAGDIDWLRFEAQANKSYIIQVENIGPRSDAVIFLHDSCNQDPHTSGENAFGTVVTLEWDSVKNGLYYLQLRQYDPGFFGTDANYRVTVQMDKQPPSAPTNPRCVSVNSTTLAVQWKRSPERDITRYRINYSNLSGTDSRSDDVFGADTTYYQLNGLTPNDTYQMRIQALDYSGNESQLSGQVQCLVRVPEDTTVPVIVLQQPSASDVFTTTASQVTISGQVSDAGNNLSRAYVKNNANGAEGNDFTLEGSSDTFRISNLPLSKGDNSIRLQVFDAAGNKGERLLIVRRLGDSPGAVIIVAGHNETFGLQTNIYSSANRAYRIFRSAGFSPDDIYYLAPVAQDANNDNAPDTRAVTLNPAAVQQAITVWAKAKVDANKPLFLYLMDHGLEDQFCVSGCTAGNHFTPAELDTWLRQLESESGVVDVTVVMEACVSGSFIHRKNVTDSISKVNRVIVTSTGYNNNAYASAQGAYFSDVFFSCIADSGTLKSCFDEARGAVNTAGVNQTPFLDDNGDGVYNASDGTVAQNRYVTRFFSSVRPRILATDLQLQNTDGTLTAVVEAGAEAIDLVWAAVYPPGFQEPSEVTLNLNVPVVRLEPLANKPGHYQTVYPNGFPHLAQGDYRVIFYAQDRAGLNAKPVRQGEAPHSAIQLYLPSVMR